MSKQLRILAPSLFSIATVIGFPSWAVEPSGTGWQSLFDGETIGSEWEQVGESNWRVEDGAIVADERSSETPAHLRTKASYKDVEVYAEFWASDDANSGVFLRCSEPDSVSFRTCYEVNIFDQRPDPTYGTGAIVELAGVDPMPKAGGKWNTFMITAKGPTLTVYLNGEKTVELTDDTYTEGPLTLQHATGVIKFRKVAIRPL